MPATAARYGVPYVAMHMKGDPRTMQTLTDYKRDITAEVTAYFETKTADLLAAGIKRENIILDPGFGFAKACTVSAHWGTPYWRAFRASR